MIYLDPLLWGGLALLGQALVQRLGWGWPVVAIWLPVSGFRL